MKKKTIFRVILFILAITIGGILGKLLLVGFEPIKISLFAIICGVSGYVFNAIDKHLNE